MGEYLERRPDEMLNGRREKLIDTPTQALRRMSRLFNIWRQRSNRGFHGMLILRREERWRRALFLVEVLSDNIDLGLELLCEIGKVRHEW